MGHRELMGHWDESLGSQHNLDLLIRLNKLSSGVVAIATESISNGTTIKTKKKSFSTRQLERDSKSRHVTTEIYSARTHILAAYVKVALYWDLPTFHIYMKCLR